MKQRCILDRSRSGMAIPGPPPSWKGASRRGHVAGGHDLRICRPPTRLVGRKVAGSASDTGDVLRPSAQDAAGVDHDLLLQARRLQRLELAVVDEKEDDVGLLDRRLEPHELEAVARLEVRLARYDLPDLLVADAPRNEQRRRFPDIVDVGLEGQAETRDRRSLEPLRLLPDLGQDPLRFAVVDLARRTDEAGVLRRLRDQKPRVDRDAMTADAGSRLQDVDPRVAVGEPDQLPYVDAEAVAQDRELVGEVE
jgi:hypothetical protein